MILPGDIVWDRFRVTRVEKDRSGCAWLAPLNPADPRIDPKPTHILLSLEPATRPVLADMLAIVWRGANVPSTHATIFQSGDAHVHIPLIGNIEWRGTPDAGGVVLLDASATPPLEALTSSAPHATGRVLKLISNFAAALERLHDTAAAAPGGSLDFCRAAVALLNPRGTSLSVDGTRLIFSTHPAPPEPALTPPYWTFYAAPEAIAGCNCTEATLIFGLAQLALVLAFDASKTPPDNLPQGWLRLATPDIASKEFKRDPRAASLPKEVNAFLTKCLRPLPANRFATLAKFRAALKKLLRNEGERIDVIEAPVSLPLALSTKEPIPSGMTLIAAGQFLSGEKKAPRTLRAFAIDTLPVTERDYREFLKAIHREPLPEGPGSRAAKYDKHPVVNITWREAEEYADHHGKRLPTIYEWEKAARGNDGRKFPYGNEYIANTGKLRANGINTAPGKEVVKETSPAGSFPKGASPFGILDTAGNVLEWTSTARRQGERIFRALKGACFLDGSVELSRCTAVQYKKPDARENCIGFRCVKDV